MFSMTTNLEELKATLIGLEPGKAAGLHHEVYAELFPPGEPDERAKKAAYELARSTGCQIENRPELVLFVKG
jgi:hypothetical protein